MIKMKKSLVFISLLLILCICLGTVSATDISVNDMDKVDMGISQEISNQIVKNTQNTEIVQEDPSKNVEVRNPQVNLTTLRDLDNEIKNLKYGATINLTKDYKADSDDESIIIDKLLIIDGYGHIIDGSKITQIFKIVCDNVTLKNINFINGKTDGSGGAIYCYGANCSVVNCSFINCSADFGGAIYWTGFDGIVSNCIFINSTADNVGGAIDWSANGTVKNCTFQNNTAVSGGALYLYSEYVTISNSLFNHNSGYEGGAIFIAEYIETISDSTIIDTILDLFTHKKSKRTIVDSTFQDNNASYGGAIFVHNSDSSVINCTFINSTADEEECIITERGTNISVKNCTFIKNNNNYSQTGNFNIIVNDIIYGDSFIINVTNATGINSTLLNSTVNVKINDNNYNVTITNGIGSKKIDDILPCDKYTVNATLTIPNYNVIFNSTSFTVNKPDTLNMTSIREMNNAKQRKINTIREMITVKIACLCSIISKCYILIREMITFKMQVKLIMLKLMKMV